MASVVYGAKLPPEHKQDGFVPCQDAPPIRYLVWHCRAQHCRHYSKNLVFSSGVGMRQLARLPNQR